MADGSLTLDLDDALVRKIAQGAAAAGLSSEAYAAKLIEQGLFDYDDFAWDEDPRLAPVEAFDASTPTRPLADAMADFRQDLEKRLAART